MEVIAFIAAIAVGMWILGKVTGAFGSLVEHGIDKALYSKDRSAGGEFTKTSLQIRTDVPGPEVRSEVVRVLALPTKKPMLGGSPYFGGELESTNPQTTAFLVNYADIAESILSFSVEEDGKTLVEHTMSRWIDTGATFKAILPQMQRLRDDLVRIVRSLDPAADARIDTE